MLNYIKDKLFNSKPKSEYQDITQHEIKALTYKYNLADAHTHQAQSSSQKSIVERLPELWYESEQKKQAELEEEFVTAFFRGQLFSLRSLG